MLRAFQKKMRVCQCVGAFGVLLVFQSHKRWVLIVQ